jgi:gamma-glutamyl-gamma-aminobutyrate hydrolase PuuD
MQNGQNQGQLAWAYNAENQMTANSFHAQTFKDIIPSFKHTLT